MRRRLIRDVGKIGTVAGGGALTGPGARALGGATSAFRLTKFDNTCEISGIRRVVVETFVLLGCYAA
jgi:hypothetical protein